MKHVKLFEEFLNEDLRRDLKKYIKKNKEEFDMLADSDEWDLIYDKIRGELDIKKDSKEDRDMIEAFRFIF
jgi:hypothetical protein|tara:strand:- start:1238 stop:1450 length:213 start_codon:yes stop_codon:yes gene_type:complete